jgi:hypothetical protein
MLGFLESLIDRLSGRQSIPDPEPEPTRVSRWVIDLPPRAAMRLGSFRTKEEALDYRREYIMRTIREAEPFELPF